MTARPKSKAKAGPKSKMGKVKVENVDVVEPESPLEEQPVEVPLLPVVEVMTCFNQRSTEGRVVINPPQRMAPLKTHLTEEKWYFCRFCGRSYVDPIKYNAHVEEHEKQQGLKTENDSDDDPGVDSEDEVLINYKNKISEVNPGQKKLAAVMRCLECGVRYRSLQERREHVTKFHSNYTCDQCGTGFRLSHYMKSHVKKCHNPDNTFQCPHCPCKLGKSIALSHHICVYHGVGRKNASSQRYVQQKVAAVKNKAKLIQRKKADISTSSPSPIRATRVVSNILFRCKICKKTFRKAHDLRDHHRVHTGEKPIPCKFCPQMFRTANNLWGHVKSNHTNGTFECSYCSCAFKNLKGRTTHLQRFHSDEVTEV